MRACVVFPKANGGCYLFFAICISLIADGEGKRRKKMLLAVSSGKRGRKIFVSR